MELSQIIQTIIVVFLFGGILLYFVLLCIFKKKANITIVKKRVNTHKVCLSSRKCIKGARKSA